MTAITWADRTTVTASNLLLTHNLAIGGGGDTGGLLAGLGLGGGLANFLQTTATLSNSTIEDNQAQGGAAGPGDNGGEGLGGGIANLLGATFTLGNCTVDHNRASGGEGEDRQIRPEIERDRRRAAGQTEQRGTRPEREDDSRGATGSDDDQGRGNRCDPAEICILEE